MPGKPGSPMRKESEDVGKPSLDGVHGAGKFPQDFAMRVQPEKCMGAFAWRNACNRKRPKPSRNGVQATRKMHGEPSRPATKHCSYRPTYSWLILRQDRPKIFPSSLTPILSSACKYRITSLVFSFGNLSIRFIISGTVNGFTRTISKIE